VPSFLPRLWKELCERMVRRKVIYLSRIITTVSTSVASSNLLDSGSNLNFKWKEIDDYFFDLCHRFYGTKTEWYDCNWHFDQ
jgi:hypothetical protein